MTYQTRVMIFLTTMIATAVILVAIFVHTTVRELKSLNASSLPLPTLDAQDKQKIHDLLQAPKNTGNAAPENQNTNNAAPSAQQSGDVQNSIQEIPVKAIQ